MRLSKETFATLESVEDKLSDALGSLINYNGGREPEIPAHLVPSINRLVQIHAELERVIEAVEGEN